MIRRDQAHPVTVRYQLLGAAGRFRVRQAEDEARAQAARWREFVTAAFGFTVIGVLAAVAMWGPWS